MDFDEYLLGGMAPHSIVLMLVLAAPGFSQEVPPPGPVGTPEQALAKAEADYRELKARADQGDARSQYLVGLACLYRDRGTNQDGVSWLKKSVDQGNIDAAAELGLCYSGGIGVDRDFDQAFKLWDRAASKGNVRALEFLGTLYLTGGGSIHKDIPKAKEYLSKAAALGSESATAALNTITE